MHGPRRCTRLFVLLALMCAPARGHAQTVSQPRAVLAAFDKSQRVPMTGTVSPLTNLALDNGRVDAGMPVHHMLLQLRWRTRLCRCIHREARRFTVG